MANYDSTKLKDYGKERVLHFIQTKIKNANDFKTNILDKITYVTDDVLVTQGNVVETEDMSSQGFYYERLWDLCVKFGVTNLTLPSINGKLQTSHVINENPNMVGIEFKKNCWSGNTLKDYLHQTVRSGNSGGYSDITFLNKNKTYDDNGDEHELEELYFISVKYFKQEKEISEYDIGKLCSLIETHKKENRIIKLYIFLNNKKNAIEKFDKQRQSSGVLMKYINPGGKYEHVLDSTDLHESYFKLKKLLEQFNYLETSKNIEDFEKTYLHVLKLPFIPRFHQELFILKINKLIDNGKKNILVGAIPRSGKSYIMAGSILEYVKKNDAMHPGKKLKFLMMTPAPNETFGEYKNIFNTHIDFQQLGIDVIEYKGDVALSSVCVDKTKHCVIVISKQKLGWSAGTKAEALLETYDTPEDAVARGNDIDVDTEDIEDAVDIVKIKQRIHALLGERPDINVMFLDEAHFGMSTEKAQKIVDVLNSEIANTVKIYVTATYNKPLQAYGVSSDCTLKWDMNDIKTMQQISKGTINDNPIKTQFGSDIYTKALEFFGDKSGESLIDKFKSEYAVYPKPYLITSVWDKEFLNTEKLKIGDTEFGWDMNKLFSTNGDQFVNMEQMKELMRYYFGYPDKHEGYDKQSFYRTRGILPRIRNICLNKCRTLQPNHKTTQLWFLPLGTGKIKDKIKAILNLLVNSNEFIDVKRNYHFFVAVDIEDKTKKGRTVNGVSYMGNPHTIKTDIENVEKEINNGKIKADNLIILAGQRLQLGISLRNVDIVTLWNSISSSDAIFQMLFRSMTEVVAPICETETHEYCPQKAFGFMVDMNPQRALTNVNLFSTNIHKMSEHDDVKKYRQITDLINIDEDVLYDKYGETEEQKDKFVTDLFNKLYASWNVNTANMKKIISKFSFDMTKLESLRDVFEKIKIDDKQTKNDVIDEKDEDELFEHSGKKKTSKKEKKREKDESVKEINLTETATELISELISLLNIFTLYADNGAKCILTDDSNSNAQIAVIDDITSLKHVIFNDADKKDIFLKILNGRLSGDSSTPYSELAINGTLDAIHIATDIHTINKIVMAQKKQYYTIHEPAELLNFINGELTPKEKEKKENGEVFTPIHLVEEMLNNLDKTYMKENGGKSIFTEQDFKWLDPAVGIGNFPIIIYKNLMKGLAQVIPDEENRRKHILENMLYMVEISSKSIYVLNKIFCGDVYKLNIHTGSFLDGKCKYDFMFDVVVGNPPYNPPKTETGSSGNSIWQQFVFKSYYLIKKHGFLLFIHPPGWKKPTDEIFDPVKLDISSGEYYKYDVKTGKKTIKQIRQGQIWQVFKENGVFHFIYTNDQKNKKIKEYIPHFPAVDYYVYQKNGKNTGCNAKNIFLGQVINATDVQLDYALNYLPNLITTYSLHVLHNVTSKEGETANFNRYRNGKGFSIHNSDGKYKYIYTYNKKNEPKYQYSDIIGDNNLNIDKVVMSFDGGIDCYTVEFIKKEQQIGSYEMTMYSRVKTHADGKRIEKFFNSNLVKFIFLITQYASGKMTKNEPLVANSITIPPEGVDDYYTFFDITSDKKYIEDILSYYKNPTALLPTVEESSPQFNYTNIDIEELHSKPSSKTKTLKKHLNKVEKSDNTSVMNSEKILNPLTNRWIKNNPANQKKIGKITLKNVGGKNKSFKQKYKKTKKNK